MDQACCVMQKYHQIDCVCCRQNFAVDSLLKPSSNPKRKPEESLCSQGHTMKWKNNAPSYQFFGKAGCELCKRSFEDPREYFLYCDYCDEYYCSHCMNFMTSKHRHLKQTQTSQYHHGHKQIRAPQAYYHQQSEERDQIEKLRREAKTAKNKKRRQNQKQKKKFFQSIQNASR